MKQLRLISGFLVLAMALVAIACSNPAAAPAAPVASPEAPATYSVTYDANGAIGTVPTAQTKIQGTDLTLAANSGSLARTDYNFAGWNTAADGGGISYAEGATYTADAVLVLFAMWTTLPGYAFLAGTYTYNGITVPNSSTSVTITPTGAGVITVNGTAVVSGSASASIALTVGSAATITVVATELGKSAKTYTLSVTRQLAIGDIYGGGKVAYILQLGDTGYNAAVQHGLIAATVDQSPGISWALVDYWASPVLHYEILGQGIAIGCGSANTDAIIAQHGGVTGYAAGLARAYTDGTFNDWYLPSKNELSKLFLNRVAIGNFELAGWGFYWSSSEDGGSNAWKQVFRNNDGSLGNTSKSITGRVRAVRAF